MIVEVVDYTDNMHIHHSVEFVETREKYLYLVEKNGKLQAAYAPNSWKYVSTEKTGE